MSKPYKKLVAASLLAVISITMMVTATYAWFSLAGNPVLNGVQIQIGGDNTIMLAPDMSATIDGQVVHYPGRFDKTMNIMNEKSYEYLHELTGLSPVSTADGTHWFIPVSDDSGMQDIRDLEQFDMDTTLAHANKTTGTEGGYFYLDFWVVSPMDHCTLRLGIGEDGAATYLLELPSPVADDSKESGYRLDDTPGAIGTCARVGFLVNNDGVLDNSDMQAYIDSQYYREEFKSLRGIYQEPGQDLGSEQYDFLIYEPNGEVHSNEGIAYIQSDKGLTIDFCENGSYMVTRPIAYRNGNRVLADIGGDLQVQRQNSWKQTADGEILLDQMFQASMLGKDTSDWSEDRIMAHFYDDYLQHQVAPYVSPAQFFAETWALYYAGNVNKTSAVQVEAQLLSDVVEDAAIVRLERNIPQRIRMFVWLEGQDVDCSSSAAEAYFTLGIELAGSTED